MELKDGKKHTCGLRRPFGVAGTTRPISGEDTGAGTVGRESGNRRSCRRLWLRDGDADPELRRIPL